MKILIIALPRTGSTNLMDKIARENNLSPIFEPFDKRKSYLYSSSLDNVVVKTIVEQHPNNLDLCKDFKEVILLSRRNFIEHLESVAFLYHNIPKGYHNNTHYSYSTPPQDIIDLAHRRINEMNAELETLSEQLNIPIQYYEDLFDPNGPDRLRIKSVEKNLL